MTAYLINKNLCLMFHLRRVIGRGRALAICRALESIILTIKEREVYNGNSNKK